MEVSPMRFVSRALLAALVCSVALSGCKKEETDATNDQPGFAFTVYPGSHYLPQLTELSKQAHRMIRPSEEIPPTAIYDVDAPVDKVAEFYAKAYGYNTVAPDATNNLSVSKPPAYYRTGDLSADEKAIEPLLPKLNVKADLTKAQGKYRAAEIEPRPNRPRVTVQRPYFDVTTSQVVDRTIILMTR
jgi:hypothetical protein